MMQKLMAQSYQIGLKLSKLFLPSTKQNLDGILFRTSEGLVAEWLECFSAVENVCYSGHVLRNRAMFTSFLSNRQ